MLLPAIIRIGLMYWRGQRPRASDMEQIVKYMRRRRERGLPALPSGPVKRLQGMGRADPNRLVGLQERKLKKTVEYVYRYVPFYRETMDAMGVQPADIRSLADVRKLPITRRQQLAENTEAFISREPGLIAAVTAQTGGTTGKKLQLYLTTEELEYYVTGEALALLAVGYLGPEKIMQIHFTDDAIESMILTRAAHKTGALVLPPATEATLDDHVEAIFKERHIPGKEAKVSWMMVSPSHLWALTRRAEELGVDFRESGIKRISTGGTMVSDDLKQRVLDTWGIPLTEGYGLTEVFTCAAGECGQSDRMHFTDMSGYAEVLDPETEEPVPAGQPGVLTITTFYPDRELMPLLRYWTDDLVILSPDRICACGLPTTQIVDIVGRADYMVKVGPQPFYPQAIGDSLLAFPELVLPPRFTLRTEQRGETQHAILDVEVARSLSPQEEHELCERVKDGVVVSRYWQVKVGLIKLHVNLRPEGSMEHPFPYKHRHLVLAQRESEA